MVKIYYLRNKYMNQITLSIYTISELVQESILSQTVLQILEIYFSQIRSIKLETGEDRELIEACLQGQILEVTDE